MNFLQVKNYFTNIDKVTDVCVGMDDDLECYKKASDLNDAFDTMKMNFIKTCGPCLLDKKMFHDDGEREKHCVDKKPVNEIFSCDDLIARGIESLPFMKM